MASSFIRASFRSFGEPRNGRQVIVVTHNANIAVLGDAEQIIVMRASNEKGVIVSRGSIDGLTHTGSGMRVARRLA